MAVLFRLCMIDLALTVVARALSQVMFQGVCQEALVFLWSGCSFLLSSQV